MAIERGELVDKPPVDKPPVDKAAWRRAGLLFGLATVLLFAGYFETVVATLDVWISSRTYGYGFIILPLALYLIFQRRHRLAALTPRPCFWALVWIAGALLGELVGSVVSIMVLKQLAFIALWQGLFALLFGWAVTRAVLFPLFYLVFLVPMGKEIVPFLQTTTAELTVPLLRASGIPTYLEGIYIEIPTGSFVVAEICSGARFLITSVVLGVLACNLFFRTWPRRVVFMALCLVVPILANGLRAYGIVMIAHLSDYRLAVSVDHVVYGFVFLSFVLLILTGLGAVFRDRWPEEEPIRRLTPSTIRSSLAVSLAAFLLALALLGGGKAWVWRVSLSPASDAIALTAPTPKGVWLPVTETLPDGPLADWTPRFAGADTHLLQGYQDAEGPIALFIAYYRYQRAGHEAIASGNSFVGARHQITRFEKVPLTLPGGEEWAIQETLVQAPGGPRLIWSWYEIGGTTTASAVEGKLLEVWHTLSGGSRDAAAFALALPASGDLRQDRARLTSFLQDLSAGQGRIVALAGEL